MSQQKYSWIPGIIGGRDRSSVSGCFRHSTGSNRHTYGAGDHQQHAERDGQAGRCKRRDTGDHRRHGKRELNPVHGQRAGASSPGNFLQLPGGNNLDVGTPATLNPHGERRQSHARDAAERDRHRIAVEQSFYPTGPDGGSDRDRQFPAFLQPCVVELQRHRRHAGSECCGAGVDYRQQRHATQLHRYHHHANRRVLADSV